MAVKKKADSMAVNSKTANDIKKGRKCLARVAKHTTNVILVVLTVCALSGCIRNRLLQVERLMESDIETADSLIYSINEPTGKRNRALYALLKTQIDYKRFRVAISDSIIRIATNYYGAKYKDYHAAMSWYSLGCISGLAGHDSTAVDAYLKAMRLFPDTLVRYYCLSEQNLASILLEHKMDAKAISLIKDCYSNAIRLKDSVAIAFCEFNMARALLYSNEYDAARSLFSRLVDNKWMSPSTKDIPLLQLSKIAQYRDSDYIKSLEYVEEYIVRNQQNANYGMALSIKADAYYCLNLIDSAQSNYNLSVALSTDPYTICDDYRRLSEIQTIKGNKDSATYYVKKAGEWMDTIASVKSSQAIIDSLLNNQSYKTPKRYWHTLLGLFSYIILLFIMSLLSYPIIKKQKNKSQDETVIDSIGIETETDAIESEKNTIIDSIEQYAILITDFKNSDLYGVMVKSTTHEIELSGKQKNDFLIEYRTMFCDLRKFLGNSFRLNKDEIDFCIYSLLGFKQKDFSTISLNMQYRMLKHRIKTKIPMILFDYFFKPEEAPQSFK